MTHTRILSTAVAAVAMALSVSETGAQSVRPTIRKIAETDTAELTGVAEPTSGRFIVYGDRTALRILNRKTGNVVRVPASVRDANGSLSISASGRRLVFISRDDSNRDGYVWAVDLDTLSGVPTSAPHRVSVPPAVAASISDDGRWIAFVTVRRATPAAAAMEKLYVMPSDGGDERMLDSAGRLQTPRWSPDGKTIYYIRGRGHGPALTRISAAGGVADSLAPSSYVYGVSPDGMHIAFLPQSGGDHFPLLVADLRGKVIGSALVGPTDNPFGWSRREPSTILASRLVTPSTLKTISLDDGRLSPYSLADRSVMEPRFSADGRQLAFVTLIDDRAQLVVYEPATKRRRVLRTAVEPEVQGVQWSPQGSHIAFLSLDTSLTHHELYVVDVATSRTTRMADMGVSRRSNATLYRWRSDGKAIDYVNGASPHGDSDASIVRATLSGAHSRVRTLPRAPQGNNSNGGYRLTDDSLLVIGRDAAPGGAEDSSFLKLFHIPTGETRLLASKVAFWQVGRAGPMVSPDGKMLALGSAGVKDGKRRPQWAVASLDGKVFRLLGEPMGCDAWPHEWLPDGRALLAIGAPSCEEFHLEFYIVPIDGGPARHLAVPPSQGATLTPGGRNLLVAVDEPKTASIVAYDLTRVVGGVKFTTGKPNTSGRK